MIVEDIHYMDSTHIKVNANKHHFTRMIVKLRLI
jgi:hypothetical protein